uniref:Uncharacterized protein n=1 Tax=Octopus bimaculoides TaxID=37653 RepID=A0A0L8I3B7_OCTBM
MLPFFCMSSGMCKYMSLSLSLVALVQFFSLFIFDNSWFIEYVCFDITGMLLL